MFCDLHAHSVYSDGTCTPEEVIALAEERNLAAVALTDHNTVSGLERFMRAADGKKVQAVAGME
ncbi:MAG: PHP domain-containing protein, partial [Clostridia bacterium]|nr:PHP domain-containing protein [Clostridia bacterium]